MPFCHFHMVCCNLSSRDFLLQSCLKGIEHASCTKCRVRNINHHASCIERYCYAGIVMCLIGELTFRQLYFLPPTPPSPPYCSTVSLDKIPDPHPIPTLWTEEYIALRPAGQKIHLSMQAILLHVLENETAKIPSYNYHTLCNQCPKLVFHQRIIPFWTTLEPPLLRPGWLFR